MDAQIVDKPVTAIIQPAPSPRFEDALAGLRDALVDSKSHMTKFEENLENTQAVFQKIPVLETEITNLKKELENHRTSLAKSLQTLEQNATNIFQNIFEEKIPGIKKDILSETNKANSSAQLLPLIEGLTTVFTQQNDEITDIKENLQKIAAFNLKYSTVIEAQNTYNLSMQEKLSELTQTQVKEAETKIVDQINSLQKQVTLLKRIMGTCLALFAGWYLWLQVQSREFNNYLSQ